MISTSMLRMGVPAAPEAGSWALEALPPNPAKIKTNAIAARFTEACVAAKRDSVKCLPEEAFGGCCTNDAGGFSS